MMKPCQMVAIFVLDLINNALFSNQAAISSATYRLFAIPATNGKGFYLAGVKG
jgi:hypothetical protein